MQVKHETKQQQLRQLAARTRSESAQDTVAVNPPELVASFNTTNVCNAMNDTM